MDWKRGGKQQVLNTYEKLHKGKLGAHWIWVAMERIAAGENEIRVMREYGYEAIEEIRELHGYAFFNGEQHENFAPDVKKEVV